ncbi:MAG TPA: LysE family translocator [Mucilaginibacter sp.]|jgi:threonine/homoserine/homoserine lactone efflux protein|nr:LysE family translocator [Mucilaginibacter sp.]
MIHLIGVENLLTFIITASIFVMTPGLDTIFILNKSISQGKKAGIYATLGINTGVLVHTVFAALGLSLIIAKSVLAFAILKYAGAAYLLYLGVAKLISKETIVNTDAIREKGKSSKHNFISGVINNVLNPKVALFVLAFFPQFIKREYITSPIPFIILGITYAMLGVTWLMLLTLFASTFSKKLADHPKADKWINRFSGTTFILMGLKVALTRR